jgi:hypothetical protein
MRDVALECHVAEVRLENGFLELKLCWFKCLSVRMVTGRDRPGNHVLYLISLGAITPIRKERLWLVVVVSLQRCILLPPLVDLVLDKDSSLEVSSWKAQACGSPHPTFGALRLKAKVRV